MYGVTMNTFLNCKIKLFSGITILGGNTTPYDAVRDIGVVFDNDFKFRQYISQVCKSCVDHIRDLRCIRRHISLSTTKTISTALISSRLDCSNSLLSNSAK